MMIEDARYSDETGAYVTAVIDGRQWSGLRLVPDTELNRQLCDWVDAGGVVAPYALVPASVPQVVSRYQAKAALHDAGLLAEVEALMADEGTGALARLAWTDAVEFRRDSPFIADLAPALGLTDAEVDALFVAAAAIG